MTSLLSAGRSCLLPACVAGTKQGLCACLCLNVCVYVRACVYVCVSTQGPIPHPVNSELEDIPYAPILQVVTTDSCIRFYNFGNMKIKPVLRSIQQLPSATPAWAMAAGPAAAGSAGRSGAAPAGTTDAMAPAVPPEAAAARVGLPDSDDVSTGHCKHVYMHSCHSSRTALLARCM